MGICNRNFEMIWLFSANKIKSSESFSKQPTQLIVELNSSLCHIIVTKVYGRTNNPYHNGRIPGGSSGGEASNLAAAGSPFGIGSDVGGSIRMPAFFNGIFGHKPSTGLVSNKGQIPGATGIIDTFLSTGPMSRYAADLLPMFKVMLKPSLKINLKLDEPINLRKIKLYYMKDDGGNPIVSPVNDELIDVQAKVVSKWKECHQGHPEALSLSKMKYSTLMWSNKMSSEPKVWQYGLWSKKLRKIRIIVDIEN